MTKFTAIAFSIVCLACATAATAAPAMKGKTEATSVTDAKGNLHLPADYKKSYDYLGTWAIAADKGAGSKQMHEVYASPGAVDGYKTSGQFPEGTVLVKEVYETTTMPMTTGTVSRVETLKGWFVMVKASKNPYPDNKLWGDGWGWAWFDADKTAMTTTKDYKSECLGCHVPAKDTDWIYVQGYPVLKK
ncbi:MAG TPA: cytochrome P460 family protein [Luteibacter sp.]|jgi:hypothetical protein|uniref:cytochrome P460 family protein n=1 Tax=Luteibacter sp. TaxID=1886636 RepID=UPI002F408D1F